MNTDAQPTPLAERFVTVRLFRWLIHPCRLRIYLLALVCLATLVGLVYGVEIWRGKRAWTKLQGELAATGQRIDPAAFVPPAVPDEENFAMTPSLAPLLDFKPGTQQWREPEAAQRVTELWSRLPSYPKSYAQWMLGQATDLGALAGRLQPGADTNDLAMSAAVILKVLERYEPVLAEWREASRRPKSRFNLRYETLPYNIYLPHLSVLKSAVQALAMRASAEVVLDQSERALQDLGLGLFLVDSIKNEPILISYLVRCASFRALAQPIWEGLARRRWSPAQLRELQTRLEQFDFWVDATLAIQAERAGGNIIIERLRKNPALLLELGSVSWAKPAGEEDVSERAPWFSKFMLRRIPQGWFYQEQVQYNRLFQKAVLSASDTTSRRIDPSAVQAATDRLDQDLVGSTVQRTFRHRVLTGLLLPAVPKIYEKAAFTQAVADLARIACALEHHRQVKDQRPDTLEALVPVFLKELPHDIIKGGPLQYRREPGGSFVVYSIGWNAQDDGGRPGQNQRGQVDLRQGDWVWPHP